MSRNKSRSRREISSRNISKNSRTINPYSSSCCDYSSFFVAVAGDGDQKKEKKKEKGKSTPPISAT